MVVHSVTNSNSNSETPPPMTTPPPLPPPPQRSPMMRITGSSSSVRSLPPKQHQNLTWRRPLNHSQLRNGNNINRALHSRVPMVATSGFNPFFRIGSSPLNPARFNNGVNIVGTPSTERNSVQLLGPVVGASPPEKKPVQRSGPVIGPFPPEKKPGHCAGPVVGPPAEKEPAQCDGPIIGPPPEKKPVHCDGPLEGSVESIDEKGKSKFFVRLPLKKRLLVAGSGSSVESELEPEPESESEFEAESESETEAESESEAEAEAEGEAEGDDDDDDDDDDEEEEDEAELQQLGKAWNLRPRKADAEAEKPNAEKPVENLDGGIVSGQGSRNRNKSRVRRGNGWSINRRKERERQRKKKLENERSKFFSIALTKEEIEEDFLKMTGAKPPRRPKKRVRTVQKHLDETFPGLWLSGLGADTHRFPDLPL